MNSKNEDTPNHIRATVVESETLRITAAIAEIYNLGNELVDLGEAVKQALNLHDAHLTHHELSQKSARISTLSHDIARLALDLKRQAADLEALAEVSRASSHHSGADD